MLKPWCVDAAVDGEVLNCYREVGNTHDPSAVAVRKDAVTVGHVPRAISSIYGPRDLFSLDASQDASCSRSCCTWRMRVFVIPIEEDLLNGPCGSGRVSNFSFFCVSQRRLKYFNNPAILYRFRNSNFLGIYEIFSCIFDEMEIIGEWLSICQIRQFFPLQYFPVYGN